MEHPGLQQPHPVLHPHPWIALLVSISLCNTTPWPPWSRERTGQCLCLELLALDSRMCIFNPLHCRATPDRVNLTFVRHICVSYSD